MLAFACHVQAQSASALCAPTHYTITELPGGASTVANGINGRGQVVGTTMVKGQPRAFLYFNGNLQILGTLPGDIASHGYGINDHGQVCGSSANSSTLDFGHAFLNTGNHMQDLGVLPGGVGSTALAVNNRGEVAGTAITKDFTRNAFLYNGQMQSIAGGFSIASGINDKGEVCFYTGDGIIDAYLFAKGKIAMIPPSSPQSDTEALAINKAGHVVGDTTVHLSHIGHAFIYAKGQATLLDDSSTTSSFATAINSHDQVVGYFSPAGSSGTYACLFSQGRMIDLNNFLPRSSNWVLTKASGINDCGQIVGTGTQKGVSQSFLMTPIR